MPIYDYSCTNCGHVIEVVHGVHETGPTVCPNCGGLLRKRISPPAIHFRGSGWAKKDARDASASRSGRAGKAHRGHKEETGSGDGHKGESAGKDASGSSSEAKGSGSSAGGSD